MCCFGGRTQFWEERTWLCVLSVCVLEPQFLELWHCNSKRVRSWPSLHVKCHERTFVENWRRINQIFLDLLSIMPLCFCCVPCCIICDVVVILYRVSFNILSFAVMPLCIWNAFVFSEMMQCFDLQIQCVIWMLHEVPVNDSSGTHIYSIYQTENLLAFGN